MTSLRLAALACLAPLMTAAPVTTGYAPVHGLKLYYEIHGPADAPEPPLVLLHGGGDTIGTSFGEVIGALARTRRVIAFEQQGYGRTADIQDRPFTFEQSADDTAALLAHLGIAQADLCGFSNGGTIALQTAIRHPRAVRRLVLISTLATRHGAMPQLWDWMRNARLENMPQELQDAYRAVAPHPENLRLFHDKAAQRMRDFRDIPAEQLRAIAAPALVVCGDRDVVLPEHAVELYRLLPAADVAVLPATDHGSIMRQPAVLVPLIERFLARPDAPSADRDALKVH
jgi:pimeloyl-ACP methyl ester carboxylesterase